MSYIDELEHDGSFKQRIPPDKMLEVACAEVDSLRQQLASALLAGEGDKRRFPGFSLCESPPRVQRLGFAWLDGKKQHRTVEMANYDTHPLMVAQQLRQMAEAIEERHHDAARAQRPAQEGSEKQ